MTAFTDKAVLAGGWIKANWRWVRWPVYAVGLVLIGVAIRGCVG